ncbi:MAG: hypothetical protein AB7O97_17765 [Planctomycetota bacterium]
MHGFARFFAVLAIAAGTGLLIYGLVVTPDQWVSPFGLAAPAGAVAWGASLLVFGLLLLITFGVRMPPMDKPGRP